MFVYKYSCCANLRIYVNKTFYSDTFYLFPSYFLLLKLFVWINVWSAKTKTLHYRNNYWISHAKFFVQVRTTALHYIWVDPNQSISYFHLKSCSQLVKNTFKIQSIYWGSISNKSKLSWHITMNRMNKTNKEINIKLVQINYFSV